MIGYVLAIALLGVAPVLAATPALAASEGHQHKQGEKGPHGGALKDIAGYEAELVTGGGKVTLYLFAHATRKPVSAQGMKASVIFVHGPTRKGTIVLQPAGDKLEGTGVVPADSDAVLSLRLANGKSGQARFALGGHSH